MESQEMQEKFKDVVFFIEATQFERLSLMDKYAEQLKWSFYTDDENMFQIPIGFLNMSVDIDKTEKNEIIVDFYVAELLFQKVCFYHSTSNFVDKKQIVKYIEENMPERAKVCIVQEFPKIFDSLCKLYKKDKRLHRRKNAWGHIITTLKPDI